MSTVSGTSSAHQPDPAPNSGPIDLHPTDPRHHHGWRPAVRLHLHPAVLHPELALVQPNVLHVRFPVSGVLDSGHHLLRNDHPAVLFPPVCRGLPLVVAIIPDLGLHSGLSIHLLLSLLCNQAADRGRRLDIPLLWLHTDHGVPVLLADGIDRFLCLLLVHSQDLQCREGGLSSNQLLPGPGVSAVNQKIPFKIPPLYNILYSLFLR